MPSANAQNLINFINAYVRNYPVTAFQDMRMNSILLQLVDFIDGVSSGTINAATVIPVESVNFTNATDCPQVALNGRTFELFFNENGKFITIADTEWAYLVGGGFRVLIPGFDSTTANYHFYIFPTS